MKRMNETTDFMKPEVRLQLLTPSLIDLMEGYKAR